MKHLTSFAVLVLFLSLVSCKEEKVLSDVPKPMLSFKVDYKVTSIPGRYKSGVIWSLEYDNQNRLTAFNNDSLQYAYSYNANGIISIKGWSRLEGKTLFSGEINNGNEGNIELELSRYAPNSIFTINQGIESIAYTHDEEGQLVGLRQTIEKPASGYPGAVNIQLAWENGEIRQLEFTSEYSVGIHKNRIYHYEYIDEKSPVYFCPETTLISVFPANFGLYLSGQYGYRHTKLLKRITGIDNGNTSILLDFDYTYKKKRLMGCLMTVKQFNTQNGNVTAEDAIRFYDMKY